MLQAGEALRRGRTKERQPDYQIGYLHSDSEVSETENEPSLVMWRASRAAQLKTDRSASTLQCAPF